MPDRQGLGAFVEQLRVLRRRVAPPGSLREKVARFIYKPIGDPILRRLDPRPSHLHHIAAIRDLRPFTAHVEYIEDIGVEQGRYRPIRSIVVFKLDHIGDLIVGMRAMQQIREGFPDARITLVCATWNRNWAQQLGWFDQIVCFDFFSAQNRHWSATEEELQALYGSVGSLPLEAYDLAIDLRHDIDTRPCLYRVDAKYRAGFSAPVQRGWPHLDLQLPVTEGPPRDETLPKPMHAELRLQLLAGAVVAAFAPRRPHPAEALVTSPATRADPPFAVLAIGAGDPIRCWPIARYADVAHKLIVRYGMDIVILGGASERADATELAASLPRERVRMLLGEPLADLPNLMTGAALCVCNGSGMSHLAAALGVPTVCILGGMARMDVWHPAGANVLSIGGRTPCQPCGLKQASECPWDVTCLTSVTPSHVLTACERLLGAPEPAAPADSAAAL